MQQTTSKCAPPFSKLLFLLATIFGSEMVVIMMLDFFHLDHKESLIVNPLLLILFVSPVFLLLVYRPMDDLLQKRHQEKTGYRLKQGELEATVEEQYRNLLHKNRAMTWEIASRKKTEMELREKQAFLDTVIESLDHPFYVIDAANYQITLANSAAGLPTGQHGTCYQLTHKRDTPCRADDGGPCLLQEVVKSGKPQSAKHVHYDDQGGKHEVMVYTKPVFDSNGKVTHAVEFVLVDEG